MCSSVPALGTAYHNISIICPAVKRKIHHQSGHGTLLIRFLLAQARCLEMPQDQQHALDSALLELLELPGLPHAR